MTIYDYCVIGGGIVGLATARKLPEREPQASLVVLEKESSLARHQTGHNSGVIHSGIYYAPGSLKARICRRGAKATKAFCDQHGIPYETCGKRLVATSDLELQRVSGLVERARLNEIEIEIEIKPLDAQEALMRDGALVHDFLLPETLRTLHVCNAPSFAATSAIPIGEMIAEKVVGTRPTP